MSQDDKRDTYKAVYEAATLGLVFPIAIASGFGLGWWLDKTFGTHPWLKIVFTAFGIIAAFVNLFRAGAGGSKSDGNSGNPE